MIKKIYIYYLYEIDTEDIRYVGKTVNPKKRLKDHKYLIKTNRTSKLKSWLISINNNVDMKIIEEVNEHNWEEREKYYIAKYRSLFPKLCNIQDGGIEKPTSYKLLDLYYKNIIQDKLNKRIPPNRKGCKMPESALEITLKNLKDKRESILLYNLDKELIKDFKSLEEAKTYLGCNFTANISRCCIMNKKKGYLHHKYFNHYITYKKCLTEIQFQQKQ